MYKFTQEFAEMKIGPSSFFKKAKTREQLQ